jgi:hypothetical protein
MEFNPEQPKKELSDAELMEVRTAKLLTELRGLGREVKDFFEKRRAVEAMIRKRLEEGLDQPEQKAELEKVSEPPAAKKPEGKQKEAVPEKKEAETIESELEIKIRAMLDRALETRNIWSSNVERARKLEDWDLVKNNELGLERVDKSIEELKDMLRKSKLNTLLDSITEEVEKRKGN